MSRIDVCRICLADNVTMHHIRNTRVQAVFEKLTSKKLTENRRPETICFLCFSQLQKCRKIIDLYKKTENVFAQLANGGIEITENTLYFLKRSSIINRLVTPVTHIDVLPNTDKGEATVENINQLLVKKESKEDVEIKVEPIEYDAVSEALHDDTIQSDENTKHSTLRTEPTGKHSRSKKSSSLKSEIVLTKSYICDMCNKTFKSRSYLKQHIKWHSSEKLYSCADCNQTFTFKTNLVKHQVVHNGKRIPCDICGKNFSRSDHLRLHRLTHTRTKPFPCKICNMMFTNPSNVQQHINSTHRSDKPFVCDDCGKTFNRKGNLQQHYRVHTGEKPFICGKCDFKCSHKAYFMRHVVKMHFNC